MAGQVTWVALFLWQGHPVDTVARGDRQGLMPGVDILTPQSLASGFLVMEMGVCDMLCEHLSQGRHCLCSQRESGWERQRMVYSYRAGGELPEGHLCPSCV